MRHQNYTIFKWFISVVCDCNINIKRYQKDIGWVREFINFYWLFNLLFIVLVTLYYTGRFSDYPMTNEISFIPLSHSTLYTGLFISPSGISDPCGTVAGTVTPKGSMSTEGETLQVSVLPYRCSIC